MTPDDRHAHLIERAAARLRQPGTTASPAGSGAVMALDRAVPLRDSLFAPERSRADRGDRLPAIEESVLTRAGLVEWGRRGARILEELSIAQHNLLRQSFGENGTATARGGNVVMITSALPGEGKSFVSLNLAAAVARQAERRVLLIDCDAKAASLGDLFGLSAAPGLLDLAERGRELDDVTVPTARERLEFLPLGQGGEAEPLSWARIAGLVEEIGQRDRERLVILDTAPCLSSSDPHALAPVVGQTVLVVAAGVTQQDDIEAALDLVQTCPKVSLLLNRLTAGTRHGFGAYEYHAMARG